MHLLRPAVALGITAAVLLAGSAAGAAPNRLRLTDVEGDANGVNNQGLPVSVGNHTGPVQRPEVDVLSVTYAPLRTSKGCAGFTAKLELAAPPGDNTIYRLEGVGTVDAVQFWLEYDVNALGTTTTIRSDDGQGAKDTVLAPARVAGKTITFTVTAADLKAAGERLDRFTLYSPGVSIRTSLQQVTAPNWDGIDPDPAAWFTPCG